MKEWNKRDIWNLLADNAKTLPRFPDGRIDYTYAPMVPVVTCFIKYKGRVLLMRRSDKVHYYRGKWNTVAGHLDEVKMPDEKALDEVKEETGITKRNIRAVKRATPFFLSDKRIGKKWLIFPLVAELHKKPKVRLNGEHTEYRWIKPGELKRFNHVERLDKSLKRILNETSR